MSEEQALVITEASSVALMGGSMAQMLANMSEEEFSSRLSALKRSQERMKAIQLKLMQEGIDYGKIPGTGDKPTLLKAGSETLLQFYQLVPTFETTLERGDGVLSPRLRYHVKCQLHLGTSDGPVVGWGEGSANSSERKYRYRIAELACPKCGVVGSVTKSKQGGWFCWAKKGGCGAQFSDGDPSIKDQPRGKVDNPDPDDMDNTLLKMAEKRAQIDATLRATATSGLFTQDVEDMDFGAAPSSNGNGSTSTTSRPTPPAEPTPPAQETPSSMTAGEFAAAWEEKLATMKTDEIPQEVFNQQVARLEAKLLGSGLNQKQLSQIVKRLTGKASLTVVTYAQLRCFAAFIDGGALGVFKLLVEDQQKAEA